jgi:hypothetical protein
VCRPHRRRRVPVSAPFAQRARQIGDARGAERGDQSGDERARGRHGHRDGDHPAIGVEIDAHADVGNDRALLEQADHAVGESHARQSAGNRDEQRLGQQLAHEAHAPGAHGHAHGDLPRAGGGPAGEQPGHVGAGNEQHDQRHRQHHRHDGHRVAALDLPGLEVRAQDEPAVPFVGRVRLLPGQPNLADLGAGLGQRHTRPEPRPEVQHAHHPQVEQVGLCRRHELRQTVERNVERPRQHQFETGERRRRDANHCKGHAVQPQFPADDRGIATERLHPGVVRDHRHGVAAGHLIFVGAEESPQLRPHLQHVEQVAADGEAETALGLVFAPEREAGGQHPVCGDAGEAPRGVTKLAIREIREPRPAAAVVGRGAVDGHDIAAARYWQRAQHHAVGDAEHRRARRDADRNRGDRHEGEARVLHEHPHPVSEVLYQRLEHVQLPRPV